MHAGKRVPMPTSIPRSAEEPRFGPEQTRNALLGFFRIMELWGTDTTQARAILGQPPRRTFYNWKAGRVGAVPMDVIRRIGYVSGIYKALQILYSDPAQADAWVKRSNRFFGGHQDGGTFGGRD